MDYAVGPNSGQIFKHLKPIDLNAVEEGQGVGEKAVRFVEEHIAVSIVMVTGLAAVGTLACTFNKIINLEPKVVTEFRSALIVYIEAIRQGNMDINKINNMMAALEQLKNHKDYEKISVHLSAEKLEILAGHIHEYTIKLARDNYVELTEQELSAGKTKSTGTIINLENNLRAQKKIFETAM